MNVLSLRLTTRWAICKRAVICQVSTAMWPTIQTTVYFHTPTHHPRPVLHPPTTSSLPPPTGLFLPRLPILTLPSPPPSPNPTSSLRYCVRCRVRACVCVCVCACEFAVPEAEGRCSLELADPANPADSEGTPHTTSRLADFSPFLSTAFCVACFHFSVVFSFFRVHPA